ncbi:MAG TPA: hypothetical protein V6C58_04425, partial [Allocoleopsis sp.]
NSAFDCLISRANFIGLALIGIFGEKITTYAVRQKFFLSSQFLKAISGNENISIAVHYATLMHPTNSAIFL